MPKNDGFKKLLSIELMKQRLMLEHEMRKSFYICRQQMFDKAIIALGRMGMNPDDLAFFEDELYKAEEDFSNAINDEEKDSPPPKTELEKSLYFSKARKDIDDNLRMYMRADRFHKYEERYNYEE